MVRREAFQKPSVHEVREHFETAHNAASGQNMKILKPVLESHEFSRDILHNFVRSGKNRHNPCVPPGSHEAAFL